jgi:hypothetical protein
VEKWPISDRISIHRAQTGLLPNTSSRLYCFRQSPFSTIYLDHATDTLLFYFHASTSGKESTVLALHMTVKNTPRALRGLLGTRASLYWRVYDVSELQSFLTYDIRIPWYIANVSGLSAW